MSRPDSRGGGGAGRGARSQSEPRLFSLDIVREAGDWSQCAPIEATITAAAMALAARPEVAGRTGQACVVLSGDAEVRGLNVTWRGQDKPTNVLSFPAGPRPVTSAPDLAPFLGDIVLAAETLMLEATAAQIPARHHLQHLVIHGLLHLLGFDHETGRDAEIMETIEIAALAAIGVTSPYDDHNSQAAL